MSQYRAGDEQQEANNIEAKITDLEAIVEVRRKLNATKSVVAKLIITDPG